jgi:hypothetical protein
VKTLITLSFPADLGVPEMALSTLLPRLYPESVDLITAIYGNYPAWLLKIGLGAVALLQQRPDKYVSLQRNGELEDYIRVCARFHRWLQSDVPLAGQLARELTRDLLQKNLFAHSRLIVGRKTVNLKDITCPVLNIVGRYDDLIPPASSVPFTELVGSTDKRTRLFPASHIGTVVGSAAHKKLWPWAGEWLAERSGRRRRPQGERIEVNTTETKLCGSQAHGKAPLFLRPEQEILLLSQQIAARVIFSHHDGSFPSATPPRATKRKPVFSVYFPALGLFSTREAGALHCGACSPVFRRNFRLS